MVKLTESQKKELERLKKNPKLWKIIQLASVILVNDSHDVSSSLYADQAHLTNYWMKAIDERTAVVRRELFAAIKDFKVTKNDYYCLAIELLDCLHDKAFYNRLKQKINDFTIIDNLAREATIVNNFRESAEGERYFKSIQKIAKANIKALVRLAENGEYKDELFRIEMAAKMPELTAAMEKYAEEHKEINGLMIRLPEQKPANPVNQAAREKMHKITEEFFPGGHPTPEKEKE